MWIEVHQALLSHRKTLELADLLDLPPVYAAGHLVAFWTWALDNAPDGAMHVRCTIIARACQYTGDANALVDALVESGFLDRQSDGTMLIHDWEIYAGRLLDKKRANAQRMRESREKARAMHVQNTCDARAGATIPNQTKPNQTKLKPPIVPQIEKPQTIAVVDNFGPFAEEFWETYPKRNGKRLGKAQALDALRRIPARDWDDLMTATRNYAASSGAMNGYAKDAKRFLAANEWREWLEPEKEQAHGSPNRPETVAQHNARVARDVAKELAAFGDYQGVDNESAHAGGAANTGGFRPRLVSSGL